MGVIAGNNAVMQVAQQSNWSTAVTPSLQIEFTSESLQYLPNYMESDALTGARTTDRMDISGIKVEGGFDIICNPDNIGLLLASLLGSEAAPSQVGTSEVYDHVMTPMSANVASSLPKLSVLVDRIVGVVRYVGVKLDSMSLAAQPQDYLRASFSARGYDETTGTKESLSASTKRPYQFVDGSLELDDAVQADVTGFTMDYANNLENDVFTLNGSTRMVEIEPNKRDITFQVEARYTSTVDTVRSSKFKAGATVDLELTFESTEEADTGLPYRIVIQAPNCYVTEAHPQVAGPERIMVNMAMRAVETGGASPVTITVRDDRSTSYLT